jgi:hypothetical protein
MEQVVTREIQDQQAPLVQPDLQDPKAFLEALVVLEVVLLEQQVRKELLEQLAQLVHKACKELQVLPVVLVYKEPPVHKDHKEKLAPQASVEMLEQRDPQELLVLKAIKA